MLYVFPYLYHNWKEHKLWNKLRCGFISATYCNGPLRQDRDYHVFESPMKAGGRQVTDELGPSPVWG